MKIPMSLIDAPRVESALSTIFSSEFNQASGRFQNASCTKRITHNFGFDYFQMREGSIVENSVPQFLQDLCASALENLEKEIARPLPDVSAFQNCIVSIYNPGFKLQPHIDFDRTMPNAAFHFGDDVIGVVLKADTDGAFYIQKDDKDNHPVFDPLKAKFLPEADGAAFLLSGRLRRFPYFHGVSAVAEKRISVTYRTVEFR